MNIDGRQQYLAIVRQLLKEHKISGAQIARTVGKSSSFINQCLKGNYPYYGGYQLPRYMERFVKSWLGLPEMRTYSCDMVQVYIGYKVVTDPFDGRTYHDISESRSYRVSA